MGRRPSSGTDSSSSFLKFLNDDDFDSRLKIPSRFVKKHGGVFRRGFCYLTAGGFPRRRWRVWVERLGQDHFLGDGWERFAKDVGLNLGYYVVFSCADRSELEVSVYYTSGCRKENESGGIPATPPKIKREEEEEEEEKVFPCGRVQRAPKSWIFSRRLTADHMESMEIPASFMRDTAMAAYRSVVLRGGGGGGRGVWHVTIEEIGGVFQMRSGWSNFVMDNGVEIGDSVWFKFIPGSGNEIDIHLTRKKL
ncbi:hypothetical protein M569_03466 [Genlisea aurea]|uniref:TF-B3 domain-containing protein n=1 Tax=Genlisea aurea TaxID=192259 RepID=S8D1S6_9LAMI|nr:hypothetical protein M569_03466 [Genlisea aurea]